MNKLRVPYAKVDCSGSERSYIDEVLSSGWLTTSSKAKALERSFEKLTGASHALAVNSCTSALHLAIEALGIGPGDKVIVPSLTFTASAEVIRYVGADPLFVDIDAETLAVTPSILDHALSAHGGVKAVVLVHFAGQAAELFGSQSQAGIVDVCRRHGVKLIEDAAHALPCLYRSQAVGRFGDITCFSFYANKTMTTGEGGMLTTDDDDIARRVRLMRLHGIDRDAWDRYTAAKPAWEYDILAPGYKYNMPDLNAAVGLAQFERLGEFHQARQRIAELYIDEIDSIGDCHRQRLTGAVHEHAWHLFPIWIDADDASRRNVLIEQLFSKGVGTSVHYKPLHQTSYYRQQYGLDDADYPNTHHYGDRCLSLPIYSLMTQEDAAYVCTTLRTLLSRI